jgi:hypothetical protein
MLVKLVIYAVPLVCLMHVWMKFGQKMAAVLSSFTFITASRKSAGYTQHIYV